MSGNEGSSFSEIATPYVSPTEALLKKRDKYGSVELQAQVAENIKKALRHGCSDLNAVQQQSLDMIAVKMSRIVCGDPFDPDHWRDIAGYARLPIRNLPDSEGGDA